MDAGAKAETLRVLQTGRMVVGGVLPWSSNFAFLVTVCENGFEIPAVYKPRRGERPLWDFPEGTLCLREHAAFVVSEHLGWDLVPPTVLRDGNHGPGSVQLFITHDPSQHYFSLEGDPTFHKPLQKMALMDFVINNADRKAGHIIIEMVSEGNETSPDQSRLWGIDHGICFHVDQKLRTVIWEFAADPIPAELLFDLETFHRKLRQGESGLHTQLATSLSENEINALRKRLERLLARKEFPKPGPGRHYPWPPI